MEMEGKPSAKMSFSLMFTKVNCIALKRREMSSKECYCFIPYLQNQHKIY